MTGSRSLRVTGEFELADLPELAADALTFYSSERYRETAFRIIDSVMPIADRELSDTLDSLAAASVAAAGEDFELGLPIGFDDQAVSLKFNGPRLRGAYPDLLMRNYIEAMGQQIGQVTSETLKTHKIEACFDEEEGVQVSSGVFSRRLWARSRTKASVTRRTRENGIALNKRSRTPLRPPS